MAIPDDFADECFYDEHSWFIHDILEIDAEAQRVVAAVDTTRLGQLVASQRTFPGHDKHVPAAVMIQLTGTLAAAIGAYLLDMRATDGWVGFGTHIHQAKFPSMGTIGPRFEASATVLKKRTFRGTTFIRYGFLYTQEDRKLYVAEHSAAWFRTEHRGRLEQP